MQSKSQVGRRRSATRACLWAIAATLSTHANAGGGGRVETNLSVPSQTLGRPIPYTIYLPAAASAAEPRRRFPVLYLLHGRGDDETAWLTQGQIASTLDRKIANGELQPLIVVMPMAANSWYVDDARTGSVAFGAVARALTSDFIAAIDTRYSTGTCREARATGGLSMGGFGAMIFAFDRPDMYSAAFSLSGSLFSDQPDDIAARKDRYARIFGGVFGDPFDEARFRAWTVFGKLDKAGDAARQIAVWLAAGDKDFPAILGGTVMLHQTLVRRGVPSELRIGDGDHSWRTWSSAIDPALSWLSARLDGTCAKQLNVSGPDKNAAAAPAPTTNLAAPR